MKVTLSYLGHSALQESRSNGGGVTMSLAPNLAREAVSFDALLRQPLRFREAMSALHDVVVSDQGFKPRDKTAYEEWKKNEAQRLAVIRSAVTKEATSAAMAAAGIEVSPDLTERYNAGRARYWQARLEYSSYLIKNDSELWRLLMPCDPVITVADDVVFFECFSADESSYGCLSVSRDDGFSAASGVKLGTTNVDYSWDLYHHFQSLRSYRETRFRIDPAGFEVVTKREPVNGAKSAGDDDVQVREEKIDLPDGWLRGFMQVQAAMGMPMQTVTLSRETMYSLLAFYKTHRARKSPRALRFELLPGKAATLVLEPWEQRIEAIGSKYDGPETEPIRVWGARRLLVLARLLPLIESVDVHVLGNGLPSFWVVNMGEMKLTLGLSGWTKNDWTRGSAIDLLMPPATPSRELIAQMSRLLQDRRAMKLPDLRIATTQDLPTLLAALRHLAQSGQMISDLGAGVYRWRQVMPLALGEAEMGSKHPELAASRGMDVQKITRTQTPGGMHYSAIVGGLGKPIEAVIDAEGKFKRGKCSCSWHYRFGLKNGPCRHLLALRDAALPGANRQTQSWLDHWYDRLRRSR